MTRFLLTVSAFVLMTTGAVHAQSFNCRYAKLPVEVAICEDPELRDMDSRMSRLFYELSPYDRDGEAGPQRRWLARRNDCGYNSDCIYRAYRRRIDQLGSYF